MKNKVMEQSGISTLGEPMPELFETGFERFWKAWPSSTRKGAKAECKKKWEKHYCETQTDQIIKHVEWLKTTEQWLKSNGAFIPAPLVYLNQQRWDGAEIPEIAPKTEKDPALMKIEQDWKKAAPMPESVRLRLAELRKGT
jgi:hypothetical protein